MYHQYNTGTVQKDLDFLKILTARFHEQEQPIDLEVEIALQKVLNIYEYLLKLKLTSVEAAPAEQKTVPAESGKTDAGVEKVQAPKPPVAAETPVKQQPLANTIPDIPQQTAISKEEPAASVKKESGILAEKIRPPAYNPINETLAQKNPVTDLSSRLQTAPLVTIASGVGLNDRFLYIRELFQGNSDLYGKTVSKLDAAGSLNDALDFIDRNFDWDKENSTVQKFIHLVHRRHGNY
jgi:hypothetical protein